MAKRYHFTGIGGVGMAGVAYLLKKAGHYVSGCDITSSPRTRWLEENGISVVIGQSPSHITPDLDVCVFTPAVPKTDLEYLAAQKSECNVLYRGEVLASLFNGANGIAVCGTHGKTTTATFIAKLLMALGEKPSWCIGGETGAFPVAGIGSADGAMVVEADESDGTLSLYKAKILVVTSLDYDHPDHFKTYDDYLECYRTAIESADLVIESEKLACDDWPEILPLVQGEHNVRNARTAIEVALRRGHRREAIVSALPVALSALPNRRFERIWPPIGAFETSGCGTTKVGDPTIITDYAHHPKEIECAIGMARSLNPKRLRVIFQPHRYSRTKAFLYEFPQALSKADEIVLAPVYAAFEKPILGGDIADLYRALRNFIPGHSSAPTPAASKLLLARNAAEAWKHMLLTTEPGDIVMLLGAGDIIGLVPKVLEDMKKFNLEKVRSANPLQLSNHSFFRTGGVSFGKLIHSMPPSGSEAIILGAGSNTWFSDCATDLDIVKAPPESTAAKAGSSLIDGRPELAFMAGIPGTIGGWAKMNAGAFGDTIGNYIDHVIADGKKIPAEDCNFGYRTSSICGLITDVVLKPSTAEKAETQSAATYMAKRKRFPPRTCGSVFKNPSPSLSAGKLLEESGAKSLKVGGAYVWSEHANVIVASEGCTSSDILALARLMAAGVREQFGIALSAEIRGLCV